ncbi:FecR domain-containing protein [Reyranella sp.]|uniref:FecR family protein n=1 Tax=Reyranella sp. TaxID=1929291 RepID=UPI0025CB7CB9|nr:FecR domain-containing protein [Reyranella sp.]
MTEPSEQDEIDEQASLWLAKLGGGPLAPAEHRALEHWLAEDSRHSVAFREAQEAWSLMGAVAKAPGALLHDVQSGDAPQPRRAAGRWRSFAALAASLLVLVAGAILWNGDPMVMVAADHRTVPGERRTVHLSDGSTIELGPASAIALHFDAVERRVELLRGLAYFTAAPRKDGEQRPFVVQAAAGNARALGTQFSVNRLPDSVEVVVVEHEVAVSVDTAGGRAAEIVLSPGQSVRYAEAGLGRLHPVDLDQALAWRRDRLVFDRVTLGQVVDELNRYRRGRILIGNASLANRRVSGVFDAADPDTVLATIARELGVRTASAPLVTVLY